MKLPKLYRTLSRPSAEEALQSILRALDAGPWLQHEETDEPVKRICIPRNTIIQLRKIANREVLN